MREISEIAEELEDTRVYASELNSRLLELRAALDPYWSQCAILRARIITTFNSKLSGYTNKETVLSWQGERVCKISERWVGPADGGCCEPIERNVIERELWQKEFRLEVFREWTDMHLGYRPLQTEYRDVQKRFKEVMRSLKYLQREFEKVMESKQRDIKPEREGKQLTFL